MIEKQGLRLSFAINPEIEVKGVGNYSNAGREATYHARIIEMHFDKNGKYRFSYIGRRGKHNHSIFYSTDERLLSVVRQVKDVGLAAWATTL